MKKYGMLIDVHYCTGCHTCEVACQQENSYDAGQFGITVSEHILKTKTGITIDYVPYMTELCNFCMPRVAEGKKPSCVKHCLAKCMSFGTIDEIVEESKNSRKGMIFIK